MRDDDVLSMQRAVLGPDGSTRLLRWLSARAQGAAVLLDPRGHPAQSHPGVPAEALAAATGEIRRVVAGEVAAASVSGPSWWVRVVGTAGGGQCGPALLVTSSAPLPPGEAPLIAHAAALLGLRWSADQRDRTVARIREAVLHLLMGGHTVPARQVAGAMKPDLPDMVRVVLLEGDAEARNAIADRCEAACDGAWIVRCPVYDDHVIVISPARDLEDGVEQLLVALRSAATAEVAVGVGDPVDLSDTAAGWEQAYHALAVAKLRRDHLAMYTAADDLAAALGNEGKQWARQALAPLLDYERARELDLDAEKLRLTLRSWLAFRGLAARHLDIHPKTLAKRLRRIGKILDKDMASVSDQAELRLALQLMHRPGPPAVASPRQLGDLLASPEAATWAKAWLAPLEESPVLVDTVRAWLAGGESSEAAAAALSGASGPVTGRQVRRRMQQVEELLGRSVTGGPSVRHELVLALRIQLPGGP